MLTAIYRASLHFTHLLPPSTTRYEYDSLSRLSKIRQDNGISLAYAYDILDRKVGMTLSQSADKLMDVCLFTYDANGNQTEKNKLVYRNGSLIASENSSYSYDDWNRLREVMTPEGRRVRYDYNGNGLRAAKDVDGEITNFTCDGGKLVLETDGSGLPGAKNFYGHGLVSRQTAENAYYYLFNGHGDVTQLLNQRGEILKDYDYDPFGKERTDQPQRVPGKLPVSLWRAEVEQPDNPFRYAGEYLDRETGYYYLQARYYDPQIQRFITGDSLAKSPGWTEHIYAYVNNNPINYIDPSGHSMLFIYDDYVTGSDYGNEEFDAACAAYWHAQEDILLHSMGYDYIRASDYGDHDFNIQAAAFYAALDISVLGRTFSSTSYYQFAVAGVSYVDIPGLPSPQKVLEEFWNYAHDKLTSWQRTADYYTFSMSVGIRVGGLNLSPGTYTVDYYGNIYKCNVVGEGTGKPIGGSFVAGWVFTGERLEEGDLKDIIAGESSNVSLGRVIGGGLVYTSGGDICVEMGVMTPQCSINNVETKQIGNLLSYMDDLKRALGDLSNKIKF